MVGYTAVQNLREIQIWREIQIPAGDDETGSVCVAAVMGATGLAAAVAWMELACCAGSGGTGEAGAHSGLSMPANMKRNRGYQLL